MKTFIISLSAILIIMQISTAAASRYGKRLCGSSPDYYCIKVKRGDSWARLFPNAEDRDIVKRVNRTNKRLRPGNVIAVPENISQLTIYDVSPFPRYIESTGEKVIFVSQKELAWGAYDRDGELKWWGPISSGRDYCSDIGSGCATPLGSFRVIRKQGSDCISTAFPRRRSGYNGGAPMPYCMHFFRGYAMHGSSDVPGHRDSHGCIRLFIEDARWLNQEFIDLPGSGNRSTRVVIGAR